MSGRARAGVVCVVLAAAASAEAQGMATADRLEAPGFWPTKRAPRSQYVGAAACARCHPGPAATQKESAMARTLARAADSSVLRERGSLRASLAGHEYEIAAHGEDCVLRVSKAGRSLAQPVGWAFGADRVGQTYVYERGGTYFESRVSYLAALGALAFTPKRALEAPRDLEEAAGRPMAETEARRCFGCHTTAAGAGAVMEAGQVIPGVTCEACHGPGAGHVAVVEQDRVAEIPHSMARPSRSDPTASVDFCGACHSTWWDVTLAGEKGIAALRSQPFRLQSSRCWGEGDARLVCTACHDPHRPLERNAAAYDARCSSCHAPAPSAAVGRRPATCPKASRDCVTCHMPKYEVPEMHVSFTDHRIRVVREIRQP